MISFTITSGDDEELALTILDPVTEDVLDLGSVSGWVIQVSFIGKRSSLVKSYTDATWVVNQGHPDPNVEDGSLQVLLSSAETTALAKGSYRIKATVVDGNSKKTTVVRGGPTLNVE